MRLYVVGTLAADMFATYYALMLAGISCGAKCIAFGYLVGIEIVTTPNTLSINYFANMAQEVFSSGNHHDGDTIKT